MAQIHCGLKQKQLRLFSIGLHSVRGKNKGAPHERGVDPLLFVVLRGALMCNRDLGIFPLTFSFVASAQRGAHALISPEGPDAVYTRPHTASTAVTPPLAVSTFPRIQRLFD